MKISYEWLGEYVDLSDVTPQRAAETLTMAGVEVESVREVDLSAILVGRVVTQTPHPSSNKPLWIHQVDLGERTEQVIAGAPNAVAGSLVPVALPGTTVPNGTLVRDAMIAGVAGRGMLCSETELGLGEDGSGIMLLDHGRPGQSLVELFPVEAVLEVEVTPNRPDCLCHLGIARELAAALGKPLKRDFMPAFTGGIDPPGGELVKVSIEDPELCRRYIGAVVSDVKVAPSPSWMQRRLRAAGVRTINNVVDTTNYVLLEYGQPLHAFNFSALRGAEIRVRRALDGESLLCLDGVTRRLTPDMLVIADAERPVALAGVIGGEESSVDEGATQVLLEAATFNGPNVRATSRAFNLRTEASSRFEKTLSPELALAGARRAVSLLHEIAGGRVHRDWADEYPRPQEPVRIHMSPADVDAVLGVHVPLEDGEAILQRLGFHVRVEEGGAWDVLPPVFRLDVNIPEDVVEEIGRMHGYDKVPATVPGSRRSHWQPVSPGRPLDDVREVVVGAGFSEAITTSLVSRETWLRLGLDGSARIENPLSDAMDALRTSLIPGLLEALATNWNRSSRAVALFELGRVFTPTDGRVEEPERLATVCMTDDAPASGREAFLRLKAVLERVRRDLGVESLEYGAATAPLFHPGRCAGVIVGGSSIGQLGELHPAVVRQYDLPGRAAAFEIDLARLLDAREKVTARPLPRFPAVERDLSLVVGEEVAAGALLQSIKAGGGDLLEYAHAYDEYRGPQVGEGEKSVSFSLTFRRPDRTLTDSEVEPVLAAIRSQLERQHSARVRGSTA